MPRREQPLVTGEYYHIYSRILWQRPIFRNYYHCQTFTNMMIYYALIQPPVKFSIYKTGPKKYKLDFSQRLISIISYCIMPTHIHLLLRQEKDLGIQKYMHKVLNSFSHYFNIKNQTRGGLFESRFKSVHIETDEQLIHLTRYIHLNPVTAYITEDPSQYKFSSYNQYMRGIATYPFEIAEIMNSFKNPDDYHQYVISRKEHQRQLSQIKHLTLE